MPLRKQFPYAIALIVATATALALVGCAKDPRLAWVQARKTLTLTEQRLSNAAEDGRLSREQILLVDPLIQSARAALDDAERELLRDPESKAFTVDMRLVNAILLRLAETYLPPPATQPAP